MIIIPVLGCVLITAGMVIMGLGRIIDGFIIHLTKFEFTPKAAKSMTINVIEIIDLFLVATVAYIVAVGLYKLFISKEEIQLPVRLTINNMADLENKIIGVLVAALAVTFLGFAASEEPKELLKIGGGIAMVIVALAFFTRYNVKSKSNGEGQETGLDNEIGE